MKNSITVISIWSKIKMDDMGMGRPMIGKNTDEHAAHH